MAAFAAAHPEFPAALKVIMSDPFSSGFADATTTALNAFRFVNAAGVATRCAGRWSRPSRSRRRRPTGRAPDKNYCSMTCLRASRAGRCNGILCSRSASPAIRQTTRRHPGPPIANMSMSERSRSTRAETEAPGNCRDINFDPLVLPSGIEPSDDPLLTARSAVYSESFTRREGEAKTPSAVQVPATGKGS